MPQESPKKKPLCKARRLIKELKELFTKLIDELEVLVIKITALILLLFAIYEILRKH